jgi:hypothetical protein
MSATAPTPTAEQEARAKWDLLLLDLELRAEQVRQAKQFEPWRIVATMAIAIVTTSSAIAAAAVWLAHVLAG